MNERHVILEFFRHNDDVLFIEPGDHLYDQESLHDYARAVIRERGLAEDQPYIGWHGPGDSFDDRGNLVGPQAIYFGGDHRFVRMALADLEDLGYVLTGGRSRDEAFVLMRDAYPAGVGPGDLGAWRTRLAVLTGRGGAVPRPGEIGLLHQLVADERMGELLLPALKALQMRRELNYGDLAVALSETHRFDLGDLSTAIVTVAFEMGHPLAHEAATAMAARRLLDPSVFLVWGGSEALAAAREEALKRPRQAPREYLALVAEEGGDPIDAAVQLADEMRVRYPRPDDRLLDPIAVAIVEQFGGKTLEHAIQAATDSRIPIWLRVAIASKGTRAPLNPEDRTAFHSHYPGHGTSAETVVHWLDVVDMIREEAGLPPHAGYDHRMGSRRERVIEQREFFVSRHLDGLKAVVLEEGLSEESLAILLYLLHDAGEVDWEILDALLARDWRAAIFVEPDRYSCAPPAILTLAAAAHGQGHPRAGEIIETVRADTREWSEAIRLLFCALFDESSVGDVAFQDGLMARVEDGEAGARESAHALAIVRARRDGVTPAEAACKLATEGGRGAWTVPVEFSGVAVCLEEDRTSLHSRFFDEHSPRMLRAAMKLANDETLPLRARKQIFKLAERSSIWEHPTQRQHATMHLDELRKLEATRDRLRQELG